MTTNRSWSPAHATRVLSRALGALALALIVPACSYSSSGQSYMAPGVPMPVPGETVLLSDDFVTFPAPNWTTPAATSSATFTDVFTGTEYHVLLEAPTRTASTAPTISTMTNLAFTSTSLTLGVDIATTGQSTVGDVGSVLILDSTSHAVLARADLNSSTLMLSVSIGGGPATSMTVAPNTFYRVMFQVSASNQATWSMAGGAPTAPVALAATMVNVGLSGAWATGTPPVNPDFVYRNVLVETP